MVILIIILIVALLWNALSYAAVYYIWRRDCKEIGKDHLAVPLRERMRAVFLMVTLPCIVGFIIGITKK